MNLLNVMYATVPDKTPREQIYVEAEEPSYPPLPQNPAYSPQRKDFLISMIILVLSICFPPAWLLNLMFWNSEDNRARKVARISLGLFLAALAIAVIVMVSMMGKGHKGGGGHHDDDHHHH
ncbi:hypothetical protein GEMRC1_012300 [Eukaryota sp. GEM-RC1]